MAKPTWILTTLLVAATACDSPPTSPESELLLSRRHEANPVVLSGTLTYWTYAPRIKTVLQDAPFAPAAAQWWRRLLAADPLSSPAAIGLARALTATGDRANAMQILVGHRVLLRAELGMDTGPGILEAMEEVRAAAPSTPPRSAEAASQPKAPSQTAPLPHEVSAGPY